MNIKLLNNTTNDGSRWFAALPESRSWSDVHAHLSSLAGVHITEYLTDDVTEVWIDFAYRGHTFSVNNQFGEYWFFVKQPNCPNDILTEVVSHCQTFLYENIV